MTGQKWLVSLLVVLQGIPVIRHVNAECWFGSAADEGSPQMMGGQYADLQNPLPCSGYIVAWHLCFYTENVLSNTVYTAYFRVYRSENEDRLLRVHEVQKSLQLNPRNRSDESFICIDDILEEDQYLSVSKGDILAAYIPLTSPSLLIVGTNTPASFNLYKDTRNPALSFIFVDVSMQDLVKVENSALHLYAEVATSDQLMPSVQPSTVVVQPSGQSNSSNTGDSDGLGSGGVAAIVTLICLLFLVVLPAGVVAVAILLYKKGKVKDLRRKILKKKNRSFSIDNMTYAVNPDIRLIKTLKRNGTLKLSPSDELLASRKAFKGSTKGKGVNSDESFYEEGIAEVFNIYATLKPSTSEFRRSVKKVVKTLNRRQATPYYMPASEEEQIYQQISGQDVPSISAEHVQRVGHLGSGQFATVEKAVWSTNYGILEVAVKTLHSDASAGDRVKLLQEAAIMAQFYHPNVVFLHGIINEENKTSLVMEFVSKGDLRGCLLKLKPNPKDIVGANTAHNQLLLSYSHQIALGMLYLSDKGFVHRDLAARNVLVSDRDICKIADFGMSRDLADAEYYISEGGTIPIRWTAPEAVYYRKYSTASDVWSYGCLLYEIWSLGNKPFANCSNTQVLKEISVGFRLPPPPGCPRKIYEIMTKCWCPFHSKRPSFEDILESLLEDEQHMLEIPLEDAATHPLASCLGAALESGQNMYRDLQMLYLSASTPSSDRSSVCHSSHGMVRVDRSPVHKHSVAEYATLERENRLEYDRIERELEVPEYSRVLEAGPEYQNVHEDSTSLDEALYSRVREGKSSIVNDADTQLNHHEYDRISDSDRSTNAVHNTKCDFQDIPFLKHMDKSGYPPLPPKPSSHILQNIGITKQEIEESDHYEFATGWSTDSGFEATPNVVINNDYLIV